MKGKYKVLLQTKEGFSREEWLTDREFSRAQLSVDFWPDSPMVAEISGPPSNAHVLTKVFRPNAERPWVWEEQ